MACPFFEPQRVAEAQKFPHARLPLIEEYEGRCWATAEAAAAPVELQFQCCNHGYTNGCCRHFPASEERSAMRYSVRGFKDGELQVIWVEEKAYAPLRWRAVNFVVEDSRLRPEIADICARAQIVAFCRSYLKRIGNDK